MKQIKSKLILLAALAGVLAVPAVGQVTVVITGSTAFRSVDEDRAASLFDSNTVVTTILNSNERTYSGTMGSVLTNSPTTPVTVYMSFTGSAAGMLAVQNGAPVPCVVSGNTNSSLNLVPDLAFADVYASTANPPIPTSAFSEIDIVGVIPFVIAKNNSTYLAGITNITRDQANLLQTSGGLMPTAFLGGTSQSNVIWFTGRDSSSGTRLTLQTCTGFSGTPVMYENLGGTWTSFSGFSSGSFVASTVSTNQNCIGYLGLSDFNTVSNTVAALSFQGVPYSTNNVINGSYPMWGYEHLCSRIGLSANQETVRNALIAAITNYGYQHTNTLFVGNFVSVSDMQVERGSDGAVIASLNW